MKHDNPEPTLVSQNTKIENVDLSSVSSLSVFFWIKNIKDPEHPYTLEQLGVVFLEGISIEEKPAYSVISIVFKPTIPHCSLASLIGLCIKAALMKMVPAKYKVDVSVQKESHVDADAITKQLLDTERVYAALENEDLLMTIKELISGIYLQN